MTGRISLIAGGAGFVGVNLARALVQRGDRVVIIDNLSNGRKAYLDADPALRSLPLIAADLADRTGCRAAFAAAAEAAGGKIDEVWHMAANSDIPAGVADPDVDHRDTFLTTFEMLGAMRDQGIGVLHFASTSAIYGDLGDTPLHEAIGPLFPISNYGAMKLASEAQLSAAAESFLDHVSIFRFPNVVGVPATHGVILDFLRKLQANPARLDVLGDGSQQKSYLHVTDLVDAMLLVATRRTRRVDAINVGPVDDGVQVRWIAEQVALRHGGSPQIVYGAGNKGWVGDVPRFTYSTAKLQALGWKPKLGSDAAVIRAIDEIAGQLGL